MKLKNFVLSCSLQPSDSGVHGILRIEFEIRVVGGLHAVLDAIAIRDRREPDRRCYVRCRRHICSRSRSSHRAGGVRTAAGRVRNSGSGWPMRFDGLRGARVANDDGLHFTDEPMLDLQAQRDRDGRAVFAHGSKKSNLAGLRICDVKLVRPKARWPCPRRLRRAEWPARFR